MSGPVTDADAPAETGHAAPAADAVEITDSRESHVGAFSVRRALPRRGRRAVGAWCFVDDMGPAAVTAERGLDVAPHPHIELQTVTWLFEGEALHRDSLGTEQRIAPGELNLMTAGHGVAHSEEGTGRYHGTIHGVQLWVAQPAATRNGPPAFEHHPELPNIELDRAVGTVLIGQLAGVVSPARRHTDHVGVDLDVGAGSTTVPVRPDFDHGLVVFTGAVGLDGRTITPGHLAYPGLGRDEITLTAAERSRALLFGGVPFDETVLMWWNYVARTRDEITQAHADWMTAADRFGHVDSTLPRIEVGPPPWTR